MKKVFFSFQFEQDIHRATEVRDADKRKMVDPVAAEYMEFIDHAKKEKLKQEGFGAVKRWIDGQLEKASHTVVLIGAKTSKSKWVDYEIEQSFNQGKPMFGVYIHQIKCAETGKRDSKGRNPFKNFLVSKSFENFGWSEQRQLSDLCPTYDWVSDDGPKNFGWWLFDAEKAPNWSGDYFLKRA